MKLRTTVLSLLAALLAGTSIAGTAFAQDQATQHPMFGHPRPVYDQSAVPATPLTTWNGSYTYSGTTTKFVMVGTDPSSSNLSTTVPVYIIPMKLTFTQGTQKKLFDPAHKLPSGNSVTTQTLLSPIFQSSVDYVQGGTDLGTTQYEDAFQRGNFWTDVMTNTDYHVLLGKPTVLPELAVSVPTNEGAIGKSSYGPPETLGIVSFNWFTEQAPTWIGKYKQITPNSLAIFITYNVYLSETTNFGGCCIGGFHDAYGSASSPQSYAQFSFMDQSSTVSVFSSDVSALSHELGEWMDDPYVDNVLTVPPACRGGILEVGDPLEGTTDYGDFIYTISGYSYHIQDLVFLKYFGQTPSTSVNDWWSLQNYPFTQVCQNGQ
ncbi:MAG TPA: hypothetical protein VGZ91_03930 [Candidatus Sulfotelmatobacter sp.]|jgi:hypothetical protein|nr:hypothetical protein [Candidatus Sulfotelmatobacter sp.]